MLGCIALGLAALAAQALAIPTIEAKGAKFFTSDGNQFYIKGIAYQLTSDDPLVDNTQCALDANLMKSLGVNAIRVYHVDPTQNHDACMSTFEAAGIYLFVDLDTFSTYIIAATPEWSQSMHDAYATVMDVFQKYDNVAGFFVGNEVMTSGADSIAAPYVKAAAVDMKSYRDSKGYRQIPIGYSAADIPDLRPNLQNYMACGSNAAAALDFYSLNAYEWCGQGATFQSSGYSMLQQNASAYNIPIFFSETGCIVPPPRYFEDQSAILGPDMDDTWSGAIIYEWIEEQNDYGLISYGPPAPSGGANVVDGFTRQGTPTPIQPDFDNLSNQWKTLNPTGVQMAAYTPSLTAPACPSYTAGLWMVSGDVPLPTIGQVFDGSAPTGMTTGGNTSPTPSSTGTSPVASSTSSIVSSTSTPPGSSSSAPPSSSSSSLITSVLTSTSVGSSSSTSSTTSSSMSSSSTTDSNQASGTTGNSGSDGSSGSEGGSGSNAASPASPSPSSGAATRALALGDSTVPGGQLVWYIASLMTSYVLCVALM